MASYIKPFIQKAPKRLELHRQQAQVSKYSNDWRKHHTNPWLRGADGGWESRDDAKPRKPFFGDTRYYYTPSKLYYDDARDTGFRFVDWSDKLVRLDHTGYYMDDECGAVDGTARGLVLQMPSRNGSPIYFPAIFTSGNDEAILWPLECTDEKEDAARWADHYAERWADENRQYLEEDRKEQRTEELDGEIAELREKIQEARTIRRQSMADLRHYGATHPFARKTYRNLIDLSLEKSRQLHAEIEKLEKERDQL